jgi:hypothetical protein
MSEITTKDFFAFLCCSDNGENNLMSFKSNPYDMKGQLLYYAFFECYIGALLSSKEVKSPCIFYCYRVFF